jgi:hypothetical protein
MPGQPPVLRTDLLTRPDGTGETRRDTSDGQGVPRQTSGTHPPARTGGMSERFGWGGRGRRICSVEIELVALDVLHHEARLVVAIGRQ